MANLDKLLQDLSPEIWHEKVDRPHYEARATFSLSTITVDSLAQFKSILGKYYFHHVSHTKWYPLIDDPKNSENTAMWLLDTHYPGGRKAAYRAASDPNDGGLVQVLDTIRDIFIRTHGEAYFNAKVRKAIDDQDLFDIERLMAQYLDRYGHLMDAKTAKCPPICLVPSFENVIKNHMKISRDMYYAQAGTLHNPI
jgi:hypothetical protein